MQSELKKRILSSIILIPVVFFLIIEGSYFFNLLLITSLLISIYEWHNLSKNKPYSILGIIFLIFSFYCVYKIRVDNNNSYYHFITILLICIFTDIGGYVFGRILKGPKLTYYSPNKTISGLIGSYLTAVCLVPFLLYLNIIIVDQTNFLILYIILISSISQIGDILVSFFKRKSNIKDTGKLIPGHGGLLDRIDGMIFAFPFAYIISITNLLDLTI